MSQLVSKLLAAFRFRPPLESNQRPKHPRTSHALHARYEALLSGARSIVWYADAEGRFLDPQVSWEHYTGQTWEQHRDFGWQKAVHPKDRDATMRAWELAVKSKSNYRAQGRLWNQDSKDYRPFVAEAVPINDKKGRLIEWVGTISDIHEQQLAEKALRQAQSDAHRQKRELELLYNAAPVGMSLLDREQRYLRVNLMLASMNGLTRKEHLGKSITELLPHLADEIIPLYEQVLETGEAVLNVEIGGERQDDHRYRWWLVSYYPLKDKDEKVWAVSSIVQDITDRKEHEQELELANLRAQQANLAKSQFLANMSHEIRTPMTSILGYADLLLANMKNPENKGNVLVIKRNGEQLLEIINDILDLSRIEAGKLEVKPQPCDLPRLIRDIYSLMHVRADEKNLKLLFQASGPIPKTVNTDPTRLRQILINLLGNALKFTLAGAVKLSVRAVDEPQQSHLEFLVSDTGIGMSQELQSRLFRPFSQGDSSVNRAFGGSGLGLAISKRLVTMLGGEIQLKNSSEKGTTFAVRIPCSPPDVETRVTPELQADVVTPEQQPIIEYRLQGRVLVVDDRREIRQISQHFLTSAGATVVTADDGQQAIETVSQAIEENNPFQLIVMDMQMPNVDGYGATRRLRKLGIETPIIALTANAMKGDRQLCLDAGCDEYLAKPINGPVFVAMVARFLKDAGSEPSESVPKIITNPEDWDATDAQPAAARVLVVDDNLDAARLMTMILEGEGYAAEYVTNGTEALAKASADENEFGAVLLDIELPDINGRRVAQRLRQEGYTGMLIAISGYDDPSDFQKSLDAGFDHHLVKPASPEKLLGILEGLNSTS